MKFDFQDAINHVTAEPSVEGSVNILLSFISSSILALAAESKTYQTDLYSFAADLNLHKAFFETAVASGIAPTKTT